MKRILIMAALCLLASSFVFAQENIAVQSNTEIQQTQDDNLELLEKLKERRNSIYSDLQLSPCQMSKINELDKNYYKSLEPKIIEMSLQTKKLKALANSSNFTKNDVDAIKNEFDIVNTEVSVIKDGYEKEFKKILNFKQKTVYYFAKKQMRRELKKEMMNTVRESIHHE